MPIQVKKMTADEIQQAVTKKKASTGERARQQQEYLDLLGEYTPGDWVEVDLGEEKRSTVKNRFNRAAETRGVSLDFKNTRGKVIRFEIKERSTNGAAAPAGEPKKRGGRRKAQETPDTTSG